MPRAPIVIAQDPDDLSLLGRLKASSTGPEGLLENPKVSELPLK